MAVLNANNRPYVLVAENDPDDQMLLQMAFDEQDIAVEVRYAFSGEEVLAKLSEAPMPCLLILDYNMPGLNGLEVLKQMAEMPQMAGLPRVMYSSSASERFRQKCLAAGAIDYVEKGVGFESIIENIRHMLSYRAS